MHNYAGSKWIRRSTRLAIYLRDACACVYCGARDALTLDHVGDATDHSPSNLVTACWKCNTDRGRMRLVPWLKSIWELRWPDAYRRVRNALRRKLPRDKARHFLSVYRSPAVFLSAYHGVH